VVSEVDRIVRYAIHPAIGVARVGNSADGFFVGPQAPGEVPPGPYKDPSGAVKRQVARFRIYGFNESGQAVKEITAADADIEWRVHIANRKAAWYQFDNAMDLGAHAQSSLRRNNLVTGADRRRLVIDPGSRTIAGPNQSGAGFVFDTGEFQGQPVYLGELQTDEHGRLLVFGGRGQSAPAAIPYSAATTFANNDGWHDDTSDGTVRATVRMHGQLFEAQPAIVAAAPPNFGQGLQSVVTMYDVVFDVSVRELGLPHSGGVEFWRDVFPIFQRIAQSQWINQGIYFLFGANSPSDLTSPEVLHRLADPSPAAAAERQALFSWFLDPDADRAEPVKVPPFYGDGFGDFAELAIDGLAVTRTQYGWLQQWANGQFTTSQSGPPVQPEFDRLPIAEQPQALDRAALENCLGGPFHPGIELTWVMRCASMWAAPFRLKVLPEEQAAGDDYGPILRPEVCIGPRGPLESSGPGTLTRWMGVPWQTDEASCLSGYDTSTYLPLPTFWAARVPNQVLSEQAYRRAIDQRLPPAQRLKHFDYRQFWLRDLGVSYQARINDMVAKWHELGIVAAQAGPSDWASANLPRSMWVEMERAPQYSRNDPTWHQVLVAEHVVDAPAEAQPEVAARLLAEEAPTEPQHRRRRYGRGDR
jgi:hypothetical protein